MDPPESFRDFTYAAMSSGAGAMIGTTVKLIRHPPASIWRWIAQSFAAIFVGTMAGGMASEYFQWSIWAVSSSAACAAYVSDEILKALEQNAQRLRDVKPPIPFETESHDGDR